MKQKKKRLCSGTQGTVEYPSPFALIIPLLYCWKPGAIEVSSAWLNWLPESNHDKGECEVKKLEASKPQTFKMLLQRVRQQLIAKYLLLRENQQEKKDEENQIEDATSQVRVT